MKSTTKIGKVLSGIFNCITGRKAEAKATDKAEDVDFADNN